MAAPTAPVKGSDCYFALNSGTVGTPTWNDMPNVRDIEPTCSATDVDVTPRASGGFKFHEPALFDLSFSTEHFYDPYDAQLTVLRTTFLTRALLDVAIMDGDIATAGSQGYRVQVKAFSHKRSEMVDGILSESFDWKPCYSTTVPDYLVVGA